MCIWMYLIWMKDSWAFVCLLLTVWMAFMSFGENFLGALPNKVLVFPFIIIQKFDSLSMLTLDY